jgi:HSP20 family molecular chaperone IbpA
MDPYGIKSDYPYNIYIERDDDNQIVSWNLQYALSGFTKEEISVKVVGDELRINVEKTKDDECKEVEYYHKGIAHRDTRVNFKLGPLVDSDNIKMTFENGMLDITIPVSTKTTKEIKFN